MDGDCTAKWIELGKVSCCASTGRLVSAKGEEIPLRWQSAKVLQILAEQLGKLVSRDDLTARIWGDLAVTDDSLTQCIADVRRALNDHDRRILQTLPKRGYRLNGQALTQAEPPAISPSPRHAQAKQPAERPAEPGPIAADLDARDVFPTVAVLPLLTSADGDQDVLGLFATDQILTALSQSGDISVISRLSTLNAAANVGPGTDLRAMFNADFVVTCAVLAEKGRPVLSIEFAETDKRHVLWSQREALSKQALLSETGWVSRIAAGIRMALMVRSVANVQSRPIADLKLYSLLHGAVGLMHRLSLNDFDQAYRLLGNLASRTPQNPAPRAWLARWHVLRVMQGWSSDSSADAAAAMRLAESALEMDPQNVLALSSLGFVLTNLLRQPEEARSYYDAALDLQPNDPQARALRGMMLAFSDRGAEGKRDAERALHLTPRDPHRFFFLVLAAAANLSAGQAERAVTLASESLRLKRTHVSTLRTLAAAQVAAGMGDAARRTAAELMRLQPDLTVRRWLAASPSGEFENGRRFAGLLQEAGVPH